MTAVLILLIIIIAGQQVLHTVERQKLVNKIMSRDYAQYQGVVNSANIRPEFQPPRFDPDLPEDLRTLSEIG